jgi:hypothetical protein
MGNYLLEAQTRGNMPGLVKAFTSTARWDEDRARMNETVDKGWFVSFFCQSSNNNPF